MPKILPRYSVIARNDTNIAKPLFERISPSEDIRTKYANVCKPRRYPKPKTDRPKTIPLTGDESRQLLEEWVEEVARRTLLSELVLKRRALDTPPLISRIEQPPLEQRLSTPAPEDFVQPDLKNLHFCKTKYLKRLEEVRPIFYAVKDRLVPIQHKLNEEDKREDQGLPTQVNSELRDKLWKMLDGLEDCFADYEEKGKKWNNAKWRRLIGALKRFKKVSFENLNERFAEICKELVDLNVTFHDL